MAEAAPGPGAYEGISPSSSGDSSDHSDDPSGHSDDHEHDVTERPPAEDEPEMEGDPDRRTAEEMLSSLEEDPTLVTGIVQRGYLAVVPRRLVLRGAAEREKLVNARTYGEVRLTVWGEWVDDRDRLLDHYYDQYQADHPDADLDDLFAEELWDVVSPPDDAPFSMDGHPAFDFSVSDYADSYEAEIDLVTDAWIPREIASRYGERSSGWAAMPSHEYEEPEFRYPEERREEIESALCEHGFTVVRDERLLVKYMTER
ncbi:hypothetical protein ACFOWE_27160 [Planomonospora corallina]|uniref:Uncharacterized protein n=1 Tax=Planomonospora corallina TaxID=1806052 RepID=A0ABV8ID76_9ACTN